jgi:hypothetical protein
MSRSYPQETGHILLALEHPGGAATEVDTAALRRIVELRLPSCLEAGRYGELVGSRKSIPVGERSLYFRRGFRNFPCDTSAMSIRVERFWIGDRGLSGSQSLPQGVNPPPKGAYRTDAGDDDTKG